MNTDNATDTARYHNAGIFMADGGTVETGKESKLVLNTSIGQGISLGVNRPGDGVTDKDRFGGYGTKNSNRKNGPSKVIIGDGATFELNGRDGVMAGNNAEFTTGATSKVRFENKGRGVAIDLGNDSKVNFGKNSTNTFHSVGKGPKSGGGPSGSYDGYNYIGLNENGRIVVDDYATFRVQMDDRGDNAWDDVISLGSENGQKDQPLFQANKGSIVDIRDDNTNYYAELISVALGNSSNTFFQFNNPLYVSLLRYTRSDGLSAGEVTGKLPASTPQGNNPEDIGHGNILYISNKSASSGNRVEFNGPTGTLVNPGLGTYTVYSLNKDGRDAQSRNKQSSVWTNIQGGALSIAGFKVTMLILILRMQNQFQRVHLQVVSQQLTEHMVLTLLVITVKTFGFRTVPQLILQLSIKTLLNTFMKMVHQLKMTSFNHLIGIVRLKLLLIRTNLKMF